ncbi:uncharacterized protein LOC119338406 [Triticum dicoccoides]|uniref:uncharacterized protein LOC119338406 n=1 Tax=Triticum dicoccoides TaxID=85692 RepID=UPI00188DDC95|nr:uncharacterized protein LOC119338406 [Triticum dicoccoides]
MPPPLVRTATRAKAYIDLILQHLYKPVLASRRETSYTDRQWSPPSQGIVVAFSDAAVSVEQHKSGIGVVVLNHEGLCVGACSDPLRGALSPEIASRWCSA